MDIAVTAENPVDEDTIARLQTIAAACIAHDTPDLPPPYRHSFRAQFSHPWPGREQHWLVARSAGEPVGYAELSLPTLDNLDNALLELRVHPEHRRRGVGRALYAAVVECARAAGRKRVLSDSVRAVPGGPPREDVGTPFARSVGAEAALVDVRRRLDLTAVDEAALDALSSGAAERAGGYSLVQWRGATPQEYVADVAYLEGRLSADAPLGDLAWEPEKYDVARIRAFEEALAARGRQLHHTAARHDASGRLVAYTTICLLDGVDWHGWQETTLVDPVHRGRRLGTLIKVANLRHVRAAAPGVRAIDTVNAAVNDHMVAINEAMGFRQVEAWVDWQHHL
ncbi:MAG TPA: GNAT family N-acetyltransferase [Pilimelia sp.]|nr:GNAT family N-acetyltransferase [Pilimelia sp.]